MKLIDILAEELPKLGGWPEDVGAITQDSDRSINNYRTADGLETNEYGTWRYSSAWQCYLLSHDDVSFLADDYTTAIITREQYEAALAAKNDGWIDWGGGKHPPVSTNTAVDVKLEKGYVQSGYPAGEYSWEHVWQGSNIIAYRLHQPQEADKAKADDESDLNECIWQGVAPAWNGEGLPPVGCECEFISNDTSWGPVVVIGMDGDKVVIKPSGEAYYGITPSERQVFRPIRSEADRRRDEAVKTIMLTGWCQSFAEEIYDLVAAGKVPGVKLED